MHTFILLLFPLTVTSYMHITDELMQLIVILSTVVRPRMDESNRNSNSNSFAAKC